MSPRPQLRLRPPAVEQPIEVAPEPPSQWVQQLFGIDLRSLALFRILLAAILIADLIIRAGDLTAFYTDAGVLPRDEMTPRPWLYSLHLLNGGAAFQAALFAVAGIAVFAMLIGHRTKLAAIISFVLLCSLQNRNPDILQGGDALLRVMHLWILFLPIGACWSLDAWRARDNRGIRPIGITRTAPHLTLSIASAAALVQVALMYWFTVILKSDPIWWRDGLAVYYALNVDQFSTPLGLRLLEHPSLLKILTHATFWLEIAGPFLAFIPYRNAQFRMLAILLFAGFHFIGLRLTMELGLFSYTATAIWLLFLPREFWDRWLPSLLSRFRLDWSWLPVAPAAASGGPVRPLRLITHCWVSALLLVYAVAWNVRACDFERYSAYFPRDLNWIGSVTGLRQHWNMFAPKPMTDDGWYVFPAKQVSGEIIDLRTGELVSYDKPTLVSATYKNQRWRKYFMNLRRDKYEKNRELIAPWLMDQWNRDHKGDERVVGVQIVYMRERTTKDGVEPPQPVRLFEHLPPAELADSQ